MQEVLTGSGCVLQIPQERKQEDGEECLKKCRYLSSLSCCAPRFTSNNVRFRTHYSDVITSANDEFVFIFSFIPLPFHRIRDVPQFFFLGGGRGKEGEEDVTAPRSITTIHLQ